MAGDQATVLGDQNRRRPAPFLDACCYRGDLSIRVGPSVFRIRDQPLDRPALDLYRPAMVFDFPSRLARARVDGGDGAPAVRIDRMGPDNYWFGARPQIILDRRGPDVDAMIEGIAAAVARYPYPHEYRAWPGPNSNTFTAYIARQVPELGLDLPSNAIGKDFLPEGALFAKAPSGSGFQVSLYGLAGILVAAEEGLEVNVLGLNVGLDAAVPALKLPAIGRLGLDR
jgi:Protein of unknown function (DUF3750)